MSNLIIDSFKPEAAGPPAPPQVFQRTYTDGSRQDGYTIESTSGWSYSGVAVQVGINDTTGEINNAYWFFDDVQIPQGATIISAKWSDRRRGTYSFAGRTTEWNWRGVKQANPSFPTDHTDYHARPLTTASVADSRASPYVDDTWEETPDLATIFQEIVDQGSWVSGNSVLIYALRTGGTHLWSWDATTNSGVTRTLTVEYQP